MDHRSARRRQPALVAILLPVVLMAACGGSGASTIPPGSPAAPLAGSSLAPTQPAPTIRVPSPPDATDPLALDELGAGPGPSAPLIVTTQGGEIFSLTATIGATGGTISIGGGASLDFPPAALPDNSAVFITEQVLTFISGPGGSGLPIAIRPVSLIDVNLNGLEPSLPVTMTIPVATGADEVALAGHFDPATGALTPLTLLGADAAGITVAVTRFSSVLTFVVPTGPLPEVVDSGFRPGRDDWQFPNYGSFVTPDGFCFGATASAFWYYSQRQAGNGAAPLYGLYDNDGAGRTPSFWQDDADGIKLASMVQKDHDTNWAAGRGRATYAATNALPATTFAAFRSWIALTGAPQLVYATDGDGAHAMIVYRASGTRLNVADPNMPGRLRSIKFDPSSGALAPYVAGTKVDGTPLSYDTYAFMAAELLVSGDAMAARWAEFEAGTIGDAAFADPIPGFSHQNDDGSFVDFGPFASTVTVPADTDSITLQYERAQASTPDQNFGLVTEDRDVLGYGFNADLDPGENPMGILLVHTVGADPDLWAGYERFTAIRGEPVPTPTPTPNLGEPVSITITIDLPIGGAGDKTTCPAEVTVSFFDVGGEPDTFAGKAGLWANCTNVAFMAIDGTGTFDGKTFKFIQGSNPDYDYAGTLSGGVVTISGGPNNVTLVFPMP
jgi:hypothetical protein